MRTAEQPNDFPAGPHRTSLGLVGRMVYDWNHFWFRPADPTTLGLVRLVAGFLILYIHVCYSSDLSALFGKEAWLNLDAANQLRHDTPIPAPPATWTDPSSEVARGRLWWSMWFHVTDPSWMVVVHVLVLVIFFLFAVGFCTRVTSVLAFLASLAYIQRAPSTLFGMDTITNLLLIYLMIGSSGAAFSVDRLLERYRAARRAGYAGWFAPAAAGPEPSVSANFALRLLQIHFAVIYFASGTSKLLGSQWWAGTAVWGTMANYEFSPLDNPLYDKAMVFLAQHRPLWEIVMGLTVAYTLAVEIGLIFLVWNRRLRWVVLTGAVLLHLGIAFFMGLTMFSSMMLAMMVAFVPAETVHRLIRKLGQWLPALPMERLVGELPRRESVQA